MTEQGEHNQLLRGFNLWLKHFDQVAELHQLRKRPLPLYHRKRFRIALEKLARRDPEYSAMIREAYKEYL